MCSQRLYACTLFAATVAFTLPKKQMAQMNANNVSYNCNELGTMEECLGRDSCYFEGKLGGCKDDFWNCTCPEALYSRSGWRCSCRVAEFFKKAEDSVRALDCDALLLQGATNSALCPDDASVSCRRLGNVTEGTWHVQGLPMRGDWWEKEWWSLPLRVDGFEAQLANVHPAQYVRVCVFDRLYTLGSDALNHLRANPSSKANLLTKSEIGISAVTSIFEYRIFIPAQYHRRHLLTHLGEKAERKDTSNMPMRGGDTEATKVLSGLNVMKELVTTGLQVCSAHDGEDACRRENEFACHWNWKLEWSYSCWVDTMNCMCGDQTDATFRVPAQYTCSCASSSENILT